MATRLSKIQMGNPVDTEGIEIGVWDTAPTGAVAAPRGSLAIPLDTVVLLQNTDGLAAGWVEIGGGGGGGGAMVEAPTSASSAPAAAYFLDEASFIYEAGDSP